jgi:predicted  nucleic acid-binding Zn-ribbon protein
MLSSFSDAIGIVVGAISIIGLILGSIIKFVKDRVKNQATAKLASETAETLLKISETVQAVKVDMSDVKTTGNENYRYLKALHRRMTTVEKRTERLHTNFAVLKNEVKTLKDTQKIWPSSIPPKLPTGE